MALRWSSVLVASLALGAPAALTPVEPVPTPVQLAWQRQELHAFVHFGPNTFSGAEWGSGREDPSVFDPTSFDARQWVRTFKAAGFAGVVITAKHHDGFCLWPSHLSSHTVAASPWRHGKGDVLRELSDACREEGLGFGVYLSPWDRNHPTYGTDEYNRVFTGMLEEVLGHYGPVFEVWFDGANGEGPNGRRQEYDWPLFVSTVRRLQPKAVIFSDAGPDIRWVGNERGEAPLTVWSIIDRDRYVPGTPLSDELGEGTRFGHDWVPPECDVSIRPGWFYRSSEDARVKSSEQLADLYERSVGRNCTLLLNVPPDQRGQLAAPDVAALEGFHRQLVATYGSNLAAGAAASASSEMPDHPASAVLDASLDTFWAPQSGTVPTSHGTSGTVPDGADLVPGGQFLTIRMPHAVSFDRVVLQEAIALGQRIGGFIVDAETDGAWHRIATGTTVGHKRILIVPRTTVSAVRVTIADSRGTPTLAELSLHLAR